MEFDYEGELVPQWKIEQATQLVVFFAEAEKWADAAFSLPHPRNKVQSNRENDIHSALRLLRTFTVEDAEQLVGEYLKPPPGGYCLPESYEWPSFHDFAWAGPTGGVAFALLRLGEKWFYDAEWRKEQEAPPDEPRPLDWLFERETVHTILERREARHRRVLQVLGLGDEETTPRSVRREPRSVGSDRRVSRRRKKIRRS